MSGAGSATTAQDRALVLKRDRWGIGHVVAADAEGVNAWLDAGHDLPAEFAVHPEPPARWEPWHCVLVYQVRHLFPTSRRRPSAATAADPCSGTDSPSTSADGHDLLAGSLALLSEAAQRLEPVYEAEGGSNSWAIHGSRTSTGAPLLAGDPHRGIEFPNTYHQCHLTCPDFDVIGLAFAGVPGFPHFGHNRSVAWCITHGMADDTDVFVETGRVDVDRVETIVVAGGDPVEVACGRTERGPVVFGPVGQRDQTMSVMRTALHGNDSIFECLWPMLEAGSVDQAEHAARSWVVPVNNLLTADVHGTISFRLRGRLVERPAVNRWTPVPGDQLHGWSDLDPVPFEELQGWRDPERGFLVTANNRISDDGPFISIDFTNSARHDRLVELLSPHPLAAAVDGLDDLHPPVDPCPGDGETVRCGSVSPLNGDRATTSSVARYAFDLAGRPTLSRGPGNRPPRSPSSRARPTSLKENPCASACHSARRSPLTSPPASRPR